MAEAMKKMFELSKLESFNKIIAFSLAMWSSLTDEQKNEGLDELLKEDSFDLNLLPEEEVLALGDKIKM